MNDATHRPSSNRIIGLSIAAILLGLVALVTHSLGIGVFGHRVIQHGTVQLHLYNGTQHFAQVQVDGNTYTLDPYSGRTVEAVGGEVQLQTTLQLVVDRAVTSQRHTLETRVLNTQADGYLYHVAQPDSSCLVAVDMTSYYEPRESQPEVVARVTPHARLQPLEASQVIFPQNTMPARITDSLVWLATSPCGLIESGQDAMLTERLHMRAMERREQQREQQREHDAAWRELHASNGI